MALAHNAKISTNGLVFAFDGANPKGNRYPSNSLAKFPWKIGTGSETGFGRNGSVAENERVVDTNPFGQQDIVWQSPGNDSNSNADGGWNSVYFSVDSTKMYRFSVWVCKKTTVGNGRYYLGLYGEDASSANIGVHRRSNDTLSTNHYFHNPKFSTDLSSSVSVNEWVLGVGHVWPEGSGIGSDHEDSGIWNLFGEKIYSGGVGDAYWETGTVEALHRSYQFYSTTTNEIQQWWHPRVDIVDGTEPTIQQLLNGVGSNWDVTNNQSVNLQGSYWDNGVFSFNGTSDYMTIDQPNINFSPNSWSIDGWINPKNQLARFITPNSNGIDNFLQYDNNNQRLVLIVCESANTNVRSFKTAANTIPVNQWSHFSVSIDGFDVKVYVNGVEYVNQTETIPMSNWSSTWYIGQRGNGSFYLNGSLSNLRIYNRALTATEVKQNYNTLKGRYGI
jgi:hypothetical protein